MSDAAAIEADALRLYLTASEQWTLDRDGRARQIYRHDSGARVFAPLSKEADFEILATVAANEIAAAEMRSVDEVILDLRWMRFDKLHVRRTTASTALAYAAGIEMHQAVGDLILSGARTATEPRASYVGGRRPRVVDSYLDQVRMIPSAHGSFVVRALLPLMWEADQPQLDIVGPPDGGVRAVTTAIARAARAAVTTAHRVAEGAPLVEWESAVAFGVSSNLCDALTTIVGHGDDAGDTELRIVWTWSMPASPVAPIEIPVGLGPVIEAGGDFLRGAPEEHIMRITGLVVKLHREFATGPGEITVKGYIEGADPTDRKLRCELDEDSYRQAIRAHDSGSTVTVAALVQRHPRRLEVIRVEDFRIVADYRPASTPGITGRAGA